MEQPTVDRLAPDKARDADLVAELVRLINDAYGRAERTLWQGGTQRTTPDHVMEVVAGGGMLVAELEDRVVGCARLERIDDTAAEVGMVSAASDQWGRGVGRELVRAAEELARAQGMVTMQLRVLVPAEGVSPDKEWLRAWYERLGYRLVGSAGFEAAGLAIPCKLLVFRKPL